MVVVVLVEEEEEARNEELALSCLGRVELYSSWVRSLSQSGSIFELSECVEIDSESFERHFAADLVAVDFVAVDVVIVET